MTRVLTVSHDETLLRTRQLVLESAGYKVLNAKTVREALDENSKHPADVLLICHTVPKDDKSHLIAAFRGQNSKAIVIALSRAGEKNVQNVDAYLNPSDPEELIRAIARLAPMKPRRTSQTTKTE